MLWRAVHALFLVFGRAYPSFSRGYYSHPNTTCQGLASVASLAGLPLTALKAGRSVAQTAALLQAGEEAREELTGEILAASVDLFQAQPLHWLRLDEAFVLSLGNAGWLRLTLMLSAQGEEHWEATVITPQGECGALASGLTLAYAQGIAEDYVRHMGVKHLVNPHANWRRNAASDGQKWMLDRLVVPCATDLSAGEAADLISVAKLREVLAGAGDEADGPVWPQRAGAPGRHGRPDTRPQPEQQPSQRATEDRQRHQAEAQQAALVKRYRALPPEEQAVWQERAVAHLRQQGIQQRSLVQALTMLTVYQLFKQQGAPRPETTPSPQ